MISVLNTHFEKKRILKQLKIVEINDLKILEQCLLELNSSKTKVVFLTQEKT